MSRYTSQPRANIGTTEIARNNLFHDSRSNTNQLARCESKLNEHRPTSKHEILNALFAPRKSAAVNHRGNRALPNAARGLHLTCRVSLARQRCGGGVNIGVLPE